jgi:hypothetical protein
MQVKDQLKKLTQLRQDLEDLGLNTRQVEYRINKIRGKTTKRRKAKNLSPKEKGLEVGNEVLILTGRHRPKRVGVIVKTGRWSCQVEIRGYVQGNQVIEYRSKTEHEIPARNLFRRNND